MVINPHHLYELTITLTTIFVTPRVEISIFMIQKLPFKCLKNKIFTTAFKDLTYEISLIRFENSILSPLIKNSFHFQDKHTQ